MPTTTEIKQASPKSFHTNRKMNSTTRSVLSRNEAASFCDPTASFCDPTVTSTDMHNTGQMYTVNCQFFMSFCNSFLAYKATLSWRGGAHNKESTGGLCLQHKSPHLLTCQSTIHTTEQ